tara:strand:- start:300 stop:791 length:492 start_codon:yes stop_codon:yes gene_type:complete
MNFSKYILFFLIIFGCEDIEKSRYEFKLNPRLEIDNNGNYHLNVLDQNIQTLHRLNASITKDGQPIENIFMEWESNLWWLLSDTSGYFINQNLNDQARWVSSDTSYMVGFKGFEVPTINCCSYSNPKGQLNTMLGVVPQMRGDTMIVSYSILNYSESIKIVLD